MAEYIERRTAIEHLNVWCGGCGSAVECILAEPAADVAPVVRCKDCKHYDLSVCLKIYSDGSVHPAAWQSRKPEDFCSYGERKAGAENGKRGEDAHAQD